MRILTLLILIICLLSCKDQNKRIKPIFLKNHFTHSLNIQEVIGEDFYFLEQKKIKFNRLLVQGGRNKDKFSDSDSCLIFIIDLKSKKLISSVTDPKNDYMGLAFDLEDENTLIITHHLSPDEFFIFDIRTNKLRKREMIFDDSAVRPGILDANGEQLFMTSNVYGFAVANINSGKGKAFVNPSFNVFQSTVSYPIDESVNLLSGMKPIGTNNSDKITLYSIDKNGKTIWTKDLPPIEYELNYNGAFDLYNYKNSFIVRYHNKVESWKRSNGEILWSFSNTYPLTSTYMVGDNLIIHSFANLSKRIPTNNEKSNEEIREGYREQFKSINLGTGEVNWSKVRSGSYSEVGILGDQLIIIGDSIREMVDLSTGKGKSIDTELLGLNTVMDTKTGKLYLGIKGILYW